MRRAHALVLIGCALAAATLAPTARADGDPASDYLLGQQVFFPYDTTEACARWGEGCRQFSAQEKARFAGTVKAANDAGFKIRVALISSVYDMGSVTSLYRKPRTYARFLGAEISFVYKQRLLVVMPNGFGFNWPKHSAALAYAVLAKIPIQPNSGLLGAAGTAVQRLAAADGVKVAAPAHVTTPTERTSNSRLIIIVAVVAALLLAVGTRFALRLRSHQPSQSR